MGILEKLSINSSTASSTKQHLLNSVLAFVHTWSEKMRKYINWGKIMSDKLWMYLSQWADLDGEDPGIHTE